MSEEKKEHEVTEETVNTVEKDDLNVKQSKNKYKEKIAKLEEELAFQKNEYLKVFAEMENTKKRLKEEALRDRKYASLNLIEELINPINMFTRILSMPTNNPDVANYNIGFKMIATQMEEVLAKDGLKKIEALKKEFDPVLMHAVDTTIVDDKPNIVLEVMQDGYMYKDRLLRPAMVIVSKLKETKENEKINSENIENKENE